MIFSLITLVSALFLSSVAIYYSVTGLVAIFPAEATAIIIMGVAIEIGKLVAVVWLHKHWNTELKWLKWLLITATAGVMFLTSMGIFGFLSKSHVEQTAATNENIAQVERIESDIARQRAIIARAEERLTNLENNTGGVDSSLQVQIDREQERISTAYSRVQPAIDAELKIIELEDAKISDRVLTYTNQIAAVDAALNNLQKALETNDVRTAQSIVGAVVDGKLGSNTSTKIEEFRRLQQEKRLAAQNEINRIKEAGSPARDAAQAEIERIRDRVETEIQQSNQLIARLKDQLGTTSRTDIDADLTKQIDIINQANDTLDQLLENKAVIEVQVRKLEAEVGPIKYIAEFIYSDQVDKNLLEEAVRWVIVLIIFIFDPLAVLLLIASQHSFELSRAEKSLKKMVHDEVERAEKEYHSTGPTHQIKKNENIDPVVDIIDENDPPLDYANPLGPTEKITNKIHLTRVADDYVNFNGKVHRIEALLTSHPELKLNLKAPVNFGEGFPGMVSEGQLFLRIDQQPTGLYRFNGATWDLIDKNLLAETAYSESYILALIDKIGSNEYNPELLNTFERKKIESLLSKE
jgi:hypothetical protein